MNVNVVLLVIIDEQFLSIYTRKMVTGKSIQIPMIRICGLVVEALLNLRKHYFIIKKNSHLTYSFIKLTLPLLINKVE